MTGQPTAIIRLAGERMCKTWPGRAWRPTPFMKIIILLVLAVVAAVSAADETDEEDPKPVSKEVGLALNHCHPGDPAHITVIPIPENEVRRGGFFTTTNNLLSLRDLSMLPSGLNRLEIRSICRGLTGEVQNVVIDLQRPPPPPKVTSRRVPRAVTNHVPVRAVVTNAPPLPPLPPGMAGAMPLPNAETNKVSYKDSQLMKNYYAKQGRRSQ